MEPLTYDSFASVEVIDEGAAAIGWDQRNPVPGGNPGRFKRGFGVAMSQHHPGHMGYHEGEIAFQRLSDGDRGGPQFGLFTADLELNSDGEVIMKNALPDSGTNMTPHSLMSLRKCWAIPPGIKSESSGGIRT